ncbi:S-methyl-5-thioribose-1-phosphate isomerase, partial [Pelagibacteraceae bacterium]|nr:S-methyl-5-thioribose-1-phosphate isomerase [Pelagibacteraceae bacterium]
MLVDNKHLTTIWYEQDIDKIKIIDQRLIPFKLKIVELNSVDEVCFAIKEMQVRGAPLIGVTAAYGMYLAAKENSELFFLKNA